MSNNKSNNNKSPQKRIEYRGENVRISRTGGVAATKTFKGDGQAVTLWFHILFSRNFKKNIYL